MILVGDALTELKKLAPNSIDTCVTSPPYWGLRDYGMSNQIGLEATPDEYCRRLVEVFREVRRVLRPEGTLWLNLGDSYATGAGSARSPGGKKFGKANDAIEGGAFPMNQPNRQRVAGLKPKDLVGVPWLVAFALRGDGWFLRQDIIWHKPNPMPESVRDRCTKSHEYIFLLSKSEKYFFDCEAIKEPAVCGAEGSDKPRPSKKKGAFKAKGEPLKGYLPFRAVVTMRHRRSVWTIGKKPFKGAHFATFPPDLITPCVLAGSPVDGVVLDPFFGTGTVGLVATNHGRRFIGIEVNPAYANLARDRLGLFAQSD